MDLLSLHWSQCLLLYLRQLLSFILYYVHACTYLADNEARLLLVLLINVTGMRTGLSIGLGMTLMYLYVRMLVPNEVSDCDTI